MNHVLSVGQCDADQSRIQTAIGGHYEVKISTSDSHEDALIQIQNTPFDLVLINRILDKTSTKGLDLIRELKSSDATKIVPVMLISNYETAQAEAISAGAVPGFGKATLTQDSTLKILDQYLVM
jgi:CheY-like chemotaxis protein